MLATQLKGNSIMTKITSKNFNTELAAQVIQHKAGRDGIQVLCVFAMTQAGNGNYTYINAIMNADFKGADQKAQQSYFEDHCDVTLGRKDGKFAFTNNKTHGFKYTAPTMTWWTYKPTAAPSVIDPIGLLLGAITKIENAANGKGQATLAKGKTAVAKAIVKYLRDNDEVKKALAAKAVAKAA